jgi:dGTPase
MLDFDYLFSDKRSGKEKNYDKGIRSEYQRDFDRLIFSSAFRRLQNKTQVFPLPGSSFVHNRLTHSLEVSTVGRSIGKIAGVYIAENYSKTQESKDFYTHELQNVIAAACLAHDIGNPAFGHSGENAISNFFSSNSRYRAEFNDEEWADLINFEGNANALRILTHQFQGNLSGGQRLTYTTLATILKYPCESKGSDKSYTHLKKYGFFQSEKSEFEDIVTHFNLIQESKNPIKYYRHPFVYLLEAADDITYTIIDFEDAHRLGILEFTETRDTLLDLVKGIARKEDDINEINKKLSSLSNRNEQIGYLRGRAINSLILEAVDIFTNHITQILQGTFNDSLLGVLKKSSISFREIEKISYDKIYNHYTVVEIELAGYNVMYELLELMIPSVLEKEEDRSKRQKKAIVLIPQQFGPFPNAPEKSSYDKCLGVIDFISGMTDIYATEFYRKIKGIEIGKHS